MFSLLPVAELPHIRHGQIVMQYARLGVADSIVHEGCGKPGGA
jgi:hypothetical protein